MFEPQHNDLKGSVLGGAYSITRLIGQGGMGAVYEATQLRLNKRVAIKVMARDLASNPEALARFRREAEVTSQLGHHHLVNVIDFGITDSGEPYLVMDYLDGEDLDHRIRAQGRLPLPAAVRIVRQAASALSAAHDQGIVHRDMKPANVFLVKVKGEEDFVKVLDFGISKIKAARTKLTRARAVLGTPEYMSPEQATGLIEEIDHRTDQWALGCIAWEMLSGHAPFIADDSSALFYQVINMDPHPLSKRAPGLPPDVEPVLRRALAKRPCDRFPSIKDFASAFELAATGHVRDATPSPVGMLPATNGAVAQEKRRFSAKWTRVFAKARFTALMQARRMHLTLIGASVLVAILATVLVLLSWNRKASVPTPPLTIPAAAKVPEAIPPPEAAPTPTAPARKPEPTVTGKARSAKGQPSAQTRAAGSVGDKTPGSGNNTWVDPFAAPPVVAPAKTTAAKPVKVRPRGTLVEEL